ncbi:MAG: sensor histidine kinase [Caldilineaceae bacterium]|nr:sensor histidine kinase [Caldilineaceae bacterium]
MTTQHDNHSVPARSELGAWHLRHWVWDAIFYVSLALPLLAYLFDQAPGATQKQVAFMVVLALAGGHLLYMQVAATHHLSPARRQVVDVVYVVWLVVGCFLLVAADLIFLFTLGAIYSQLYLTQPLRRAGAGIAALCALLLVRAIVVQGVGAALTDPGLWIFLLASVMSVLVALWIHGIIAQSEERHQLILALEETQARLAASEREAGTLAERQRLAREIHDTLAQGFTSIVMHLEAAEQALPADAATATTRYFLDQARRTARASLTQARAVVADLRPDLLVQNSLPAALERVVAHWRTESGVDASFTVTGEPLAPTPDVDITLLRALQEALANVRKHAQATSVVVTLSYMDDVVVLDVQDDGVGMAAQPTGPHALLVDAGGFGLVAMRERVEQLGGALLVESAPGQGTTLAVQIPIVPTAGQNRWMEGAQNGANSRPDRG